MADNFDALWDSTPAASAATVGGGEVSFDTLWDSVPATPSGLNAASGQIGKGLAFGYFDEIQGAEVALRNALGIGNGETYDQKVADLRATDSAYEKANPYTSMALQGAGALAPAVFTGGSNLIAGGTAKVAPGALGSLVTNVFGVGIKGAPTVGQLVKMGATQGALYGSGEANDGNRLIGAGIGGTTGAVAAPIVGKTIEKGSNVISDLLANMGIIGKGTGLVSTGTERGSISSALGGVDYTPEEIYLAQQLKNTPIADVMGGASELSSALDNNVPLFLPDAIQSADVSRNAKFIANNKDSMRFAQNAITSRKEGAGGRIETLLSDIAPHVDPTDAGTTLMNASQEAVRGLQKVRRDATGATYNLLKSQKVPDEVAIGLLDDPVVADAMQAVMNKPAFQKEIGNAAPESFQYLQQTKRYLNDQVKALVRVGNDTEARIIGDSRDKVVKALGDLKPFKEVDALYASLSKPINRLKGTKEEAGLLEGILDIDRINAHKASSELLKRTPGQILEIKAALGEKGQEELSKSARSLMQDILEKANEQNQPALKLLENDQMKNKFFAMIGEDKYYKFAEAIDLEKRMARANNLYAAGSPTAGYIQEGNAFEKASGLLSKLNPANWKETLSSLFTNDPSSELAQKVAKIYFDPKAGKDSLQKILPLLEQYAANKEFSQALGKGAGGLTSKGLGAIAGGMIDPGVPENTQLSNLLKKTLSGEQGSADIKTMAAAVGLGGSALAASQPDTDLTPRNEDMTKSKKDIELEIDSDPFFSLAYELESGRGKYLKNPKSSASGPFQMINATAKAVGVNAKDDDFSDDLEGMRKLKAQYLEQGIDDDPISLYAAHYLGVPTLKKWLAGERLTDTQQQHVDDFQDILVPRAQKFLKKLNGQVKA